MDMKRIVVCLLSVVMLVAMMLPADIALARGRGGGMPTANNETAIELPPSANFDYSICSSCSRGSRISVTFTDKSTGGTEPYRYSWDFGDGSNSTRRIPRHRYASAGNYTVTLTITDRAGNAASTSEAITLGVATTTNVEPSGDSSPKAPTSPTWPRCIDGCTAKDVEVTDVRLDVHGCTGANGTATADIYVTFSNNAKRYCFVFVADFWIDGVLSPENDDVSYELGDVPAKTDYTKKVATIAWPCGATLEVKDILLMWQPNDGGCQYDCDEYDAPSKCYFNATGPSETPPVIISVTQSSDNPCPEEDVVITAHVTDDDGTVTSVDLTYDSTTIAMNLTSGTPEDGYWEATIPGQPEGTTLAIVVTAEDNDGNTASTSPHDKTWIDCDDLDGWYEDGDPYTACVDDQVCTYQDWVYLDYECVDGDCVPTETDWDTELIACESCDDGDPCTIDTCVDGECVHTPIDCDYLDGWVEDGDPYTECDGDLVCTYQDMVYLDYECDDGECVPTETDWRTDLVGCEDCNDLDYYDPWEYYCDGDEVWMHRMFHDFSCVDGSCAEVDSYYTDDQFVQDCDDLDYYDDWEFYCDGTSTWRTRNLHDFSCIDGACHEEVIPETEWVEDLAASASSNSAVTQGATIFLYGGPSGMTYSWTGPNGFSSNSQNPTIPDATEAMEGTYTLTVANEYGCADEATTNVVITVPVTPAGGGGGGCPRTDYLTVDWEGCNTSKPLYSNDKLAVDLLGPSLDLTHSLFLGRGTHAPVVDERTYYLIVVRELEQIPATPENTVALVVFNVTPAGAEFDREILLTLGLNQTQLPANTLNVTMAYYDDVNGVWETLEYEAVNNTVAELALSAPINHFSIYGVLAEVAATPTSPAHFVPSGLSIVPGVEKISAFVTKIGEVVTISANVANDGGQEGAYTVVLKLNGQTVDTKTITLAAGQSQQVTFIRSGLDYGQYDVEVAGLTDEFTVSRTITWWLIVLLIVAVALIIWGVLWGRKKRRKAQQET